MMPLSPILGKLTFIITTNKDSFQACLCFGNERINAPAEKILVTSWSNSMLDYFLALESAPLEVKDGDIIPVLHKILLGEIGNG
jgi:hypothetical protein